MPEPTVSIPPFDAFYVPTVHRMRARGGSMTIDEMEDDVAQAMGLTEAQRALLHGDGPSSAFGYRLAWVRTYLKKAGAIENSARGVWRLTPKGLELSDEDIRSVSRLVRAERRRGQPSQDDPGPSEAVQGDELVSLTWKERLLETLLSVEPSAFERLCQRVLREAGFVKVEVTGRAGDGGIDGTGVLRLNLLSFHVLFQAKRYRGSVGASTIRDFRGAMVGRADKGLIITTGTFTSDARREATRDGAPAIDLVDGDALCELLKSLRIGVRTEMVEVVTVDEGTFQTF